VNETWIYDALDRWDRLVELGQDTAQVVYRVRFPRDYDQAFDIEFSEDHKQVIASYFYRQNTHTLTFPIHYLTIGDEDVREYERQRIQAEHEATKRAEELRRAAEDAERETIERRTYERLKAKYEGEGDGRTRKRATTPERSSDPA
jgi:hypothetical protein